MGANSTLRLATRASKLALWQAHFVRDALIAAVPDLVVEVLPMSTAGDRNKVSPLASMGGKGVFVKELERALLNDEADLAVHSMKDVPAALPDGLVISAICERADPRDAFVSNHHATLSDVPAGGRIGSSSLRRRLQLAAAYPQLEFVELRGNVDTRLARLDAGDFDGIILAVAGLTRLGLGERVSEAIAPAVCLPSAGQGAVGIESREDDDETNAMLALINHETTARRIHAERAVTQALGATCNLPVAAFATVDDAVMSLGAFVSDESGSSTISIARTGKAVDGVSLGTSLGDELLANGAAALIASHD